MDEKALLTQDDCQQVGYDMSIAGKVIVLHSAALPEEYRSADRQLCRGNPANTM